MIHQNSPLAWSLLSFIHQQQDVFPMTSPSANMHRQKNTLHFESLKYGRIMHARKYLEPSKKDVLNASEERNSF